MEIKGAALLYTFILLTSFALSIRADTLEEQKQRAENCDLYGAGTLAFAKARDQGLSKENAFKSVTHGQSIYVPGSPLDVMEQAAYGHPDYQPETIAAYTYGRCVLDALAILTPAVDAELKANAEGCQHDHDRKPDELRACINDKTATIISAESAKNKAADAVSAVTPVQAPPGTPVTSMSDGEYEAYFKCPESYPSADAAQAGLKDFMDWVKARHGDWTVDFLIRYRYGLLVRHSCTKTLDYMRTHEAGKG